MLRYFLISFKLMKVIHTPVTLRNLTTFYRLHLAFNRLNLRAFYFKPVFLHKIITQKLKGAAILSIP